MHMQSAVLWGFFSTLVLTLLLSGGRDLGVTRMDIPLILGTMFTSHRDRAKWIGFLVHMANGWVFALLYIAIIEDLNMRHWWFGMILGFVHGAFVLTVVVNLLPAIHPRMAHEEQGPDTTRQLEPPGPFALNYGKQTPIVTIISHLIYGGMLGMFYR